MHTLILCMAHEYIVLEFFSMPYPISNQIFEYFINEWQDAVYIFEFSCPAGYLLINENKTAFKFTCQDTEDTINVRFIYMRHY